MILVFRPDRILNIDHPGDIPTSDLADASAAMIQRCADYERTIAQMIGYLALANQAPEDAEARTIAASRRAYAENLAPARA